MTSCFLLVLVVSQESGCKPSDNKVGENLHTSCLTKIVQKMAGNKRQNRKMVKKLQDADHAER